MPTTTANSIDISYDERGTGPPLVLIHGLGGDNTSWEVPVKPFFEDQYRVIAMDLRGHGQSSRTEGEYSTELFAADVNSFLDEIGVSAARVVGISMGGAIAMMLAATNPEKVERLVLMDTWAACDEATEVTFLEWEMASKVSQELTQWIGLWRGATSEWIEANPDLVSEFFDFWPTNFGDDFAKSCKACIEHDAREHLAAIKAPTLVLAGARDILTPPHLSNELHHAIPGSGLVIIDGAGHVPFLLKPDETLDTLARFLAHG